MIDSYDFLWKVGISLLGLLQVIGGWVDTHAYGVIIVLGPFLVLIGVCFLSPDPTYNSTETNSIIEGSVDIYDLIRWVGIDVEYIHSIWLSHQLKPDSIQPTTCTLTFKIFFFFSFFLHSGLRKPIFWLASENAHYVS